MAAFWVWLVVLWPLAGFLANGAIGFFKPNEKRLVSIIGVGVLAAAFITALVVVRSAAAAASPVISVAWQWMPVGPLQVDLAFQVDHLSSVMLLVVTGVGALIHVFSVGYMRSDPGYARYFAYLNLFVFFMLVLVLGASFPVMFVGWEGVGLCSYLLIGFWFSEKANADAGKKAFIMNRIGDFGFLVAMFMIYKATGTLSFQGVLDQAPSAFAVGGATITWITLALFLGCTGKSAQIPLYTWLPDAMAGPTPVSALIHAATMVTAGVYLVARTNVLFAMAPLSSAVVATVGALTALFAASIALKQWDIKKVLAYSTVSQLGYMFLGVGVGAYTAGVFHLVTHAFFKALLFLGAGSVIHSLHQAYHETRKHDDAQDMRNMGGLARVMPWTAGLMWVATLAIAGVPGLSGFFSKDEILASTFARGREAPFFYLLWAMGTAAALLTAFYMTRLMIYTFHGTNRTGEKEREHLHEAPWEMTGPLLVLGAGVVLTGLLNLPEILPGSGWLDRWLDPVTANGARYLPEAGLSAGAEWGLLAFATVVAAAGIVAAWRLLHPESLPTAREAASESGFARVLYRKYYVDEIYDMVIVRPLMWFSEEVLWRGVDQGVIDGAGVTGITRFSRWLGHLGTWFQNGYLGRYVLWFVIAALAVVLEIRKP